MKKGFTLVELLAVIVVLGIIARIAIPTIADVINAGRNGGHDAQVKMLLKAANTWSIKYDYKLSKNKAYLLTIDELMSSGILEQDEILDPATDEVMTGCVEIKYSSLYNQYEFKYRDDCEGIINYSWILTKGTGNTSTSPEIGDKIAIDTESFYIIGFENSGAKIKALAEYNLEVGNSTNSSYPATTETSKQSSSALGYKEGSTTYAPVKFSSTNYWVDASNNLKSAYGSSYPAWVYDNNSIVKGYVDTYKVILEGYGASIIEARLIKKEEVDDLYNYYSNTTGQTLSVSYIDSWAPSWLYQTSYWTGSALNDSYVWDVHSSGIFCYADYYYDTYYGVRPVIVINTSDL